MATAAQFRKLALSLDDTEEGFHVDHPDFRVRGKIFAGLTKDEKGASMKLSLPTQHAMTSADSEAFIPAAGAWGRAGWTMVRLASVPAGALEDLVRESWELVGSTVKKKAAPKTAKRPLQGKKAAPKTAKRPLPGKKKAGARKTAKAAKAAKAAKRR